LTYTRPLGNADVIASYYTISGSPNAEVSRYPFVERIRAAAAAGYAGIGLTMFDLEAVLGSGLTLEEMAKVGADHGISVAELETLAFTPTPTPEELDAARRMVEAGYQLGTRHMNVLIGLAPGAPVDVEETAAGFGQICDIAAAADILVGIEFMPFKAVATVDVATAIVEMADRDNGGLVVDSYHFFRGGSRLEDLAKVPGKRIITLQLNDVPLSAPADLLVETRTARLLPGEGGLPLVEWIRTIDSTGANATLGVEILSDPLRELTVDEVARVTFDATRRVVEAAR